MKIPPAFRSLRHPNFARYMTGETISMVGTWMQIFAQGWVLTSLTQDAFVLGAINAATGLPMLLLTLKGGSLADRHDKRRILLAVLVVQLACAAAIGYLVQENRIAISHLFIVAVILGIAAAFEVPSASALVPELVPHDEIANAIAVDRSLFHATRLLGPAVGGFLVNALGVASAYYANAASFLALMAALATIPPRPPGTAAEEEKRRGSILEGIKYVRRDHSIGAMILMLSAQTIFVAPFLVITMPIYSRITLGLGPDKMGMMMAITGVGSLTGSIGLLSIPPGRRALALKFGASIVALALAAMSLAPNFPLAALSAVTLTVGLSVCFGIENIVIQERAPKELRGRISSITGLSFFGLLPFSGLLITFLIDRFGMRHVLLASACGFALAASVLLFGRKHLASAPHPEAIGAPD